MALRHGHVLRGRVFVLKELQGAVADVVVIVSGSNVIKTEARIE